jgi:RNA polymerase sigma-70 factor, ECF subfamily
MTLEQPLPRTAEQFRELFHAHYGEIWAFARNRIGNAADADDIAAETFTIGWRRSGELLQADLPRAWLFATARWVLANHIRGQGRRTRLTDYLAQANQRLAEIPDVTERMLAEALEKLAPEDREVLLLRAWDGLTAAETAAVLGCSTNAVNIRLHRARSRLAEILGYEIRKGPTTLRHTTSEPTNPEGGRHATQRG